MHPNHLRRAVTAAKRGLAVAVCSAAAAALLPAGAATAATPTDWNAPAMSGVLGKHGAEAAARFEQWRGRDVPLVVDYLGSRTWASMSEASWAPYRWRGTDHHVVWSLPMLPSDEWASLRNGANGQYNHHFRSIAQDLVAGGHGSSTIRLGWENTGNWFPWSGTKDPAAYAAFWRQIVTTMRSVSGARFTFDFNISDQDVDPRPMYPGDAYVDFIGGDFYDHSWSSSFPATAHERAWNHLVTKPYGLDWLAGWAASRGKRLSLPEWGLSKRCDGHGGGDNPYFLERMRAWIDRHEVAYEAYFDADDHSCQRFRISDGSTFPNAAQTYKRLWGTSAATYVAPAPAPQYTPTSSGSLSVESVRASTSSSRAGSWSLHQSRLSGWRHIFVNAPSDTVKVSFWLDRSTGSTPTHVEHHAPWDLAGGSSAAANGTHIDPLWAGTHTLVVQTVSSSGAVRSVTTTFTTD